MGTHSGFVREECTDPATVQLEHALPQVSKHCVENAASYAPALANMLFQYRSEGYSLHGRLALDSFSKVSVWLNGTSPWKPHAAQLFMKWPSSDMILCACGPQVLSIITKSSFIPICSNMWWSLSWATKRHVGHCLACFSLIPSWDPSPKHLPYMVWIGQGLEESNCLQSFPEGVQFLATWLNGSYL